MDVGMSAIASESRTTAIWERILCPETGGLTPEQARAFLALRVPQSDRDRVNELSAKARAGTLTEEEEAELDEYLLVDSFLTSLKAKARISLQQVEAAT